VSMEHADRARLAHRVLRLRENGVDSERNVKRLADTVSISKDGDDQAIGGTGHPLGSIAVRVLNANDANRPGPTDTKLVEKLFGSDLTSIWKSWDEAVTANLEATLDAKDLKAWRASTERDQKAFEERVAQMEETGDWPVHPYFGHNRHLDGAANALFDLGREGFLGGAIDGDTAVFKVDLVDSADYTVNLATHQFRSSIAVAGREESSAALSSVTITAGVFDAADITFTAAAGDPCEALVIYQSSAVGGGADVADTAQRLVGYIDTATGLPVTLNGGNVSVTWDNGANRIFKL
jgi:hypothetical protein